MAPLLPALVAFLLLLLVPGSNPARSLGVGELEHLVQRDVPRRRCVCEAPPLHSVHHIRAWPQSHSAAGDAALFDARHRRWRPVPGVRSHLGTHHRRRFRLHPVAGCRAWCEQVRATRRRRRRAAVASLAFHDRHVVYRRSRRHHRDGGSAHAHSYASGKLLPASRMELDSPQAALAATAAGDYHLQYRHQLPMIETRVPLAQSASWGDAGRARTAAPADCESEPQAGGGVLAVMPAEDAGNDTGTSPAAPGGHVDGGAGGPGACKPGEGMTAGEVYAHLLKQDRARMAAWKRRRHAQQRRGSRVWRSESFEYGAWDWLSGGGLVWRVVMVGLVLAIMVVWVQWELGETMKAAL